MPGGSGWLLLALLAGALIAVQGPVYTRMAADLGGAVPAALIAFAVGALVVFFALKITGGQMPTIDQMRAMPYWTWPGGMIGVVVVLTSVVVIQRTGVSAYIVAAIAGQVLAGWLIDRSGAFGMPVRMFSSVNMLGLMLVIAGMVLVRFK